jgi:hypothetical protein
LILRQSKNIHLVTQSLSDYFRIFLFYEYSYFGYCLCTVFNTTSSIALRIQLCGMIGLKSCLRLEHSAHLLRDLPLTCLACTWLTALSLQCHPTSDQITKRLIYGFTHTKNQRHWANGNGIFVHGRSTAAAPTHPPVGFVHILYVLTTNFSTGLLL